MFRTNFLILVRSLEVLDVSCVRYAHGNRKYMARRLRKPKAQYMYSPLPPVHHVKRGEKFAQRYVDKYGVRSEKFVPVSKLPAPRWHWDYDITKENTDFVKKVVKNDSAKLEESALSSPLNEELWPLQKWRPRSLRCGAIGIKMGVHPIWFKDGTYCNATLLQIVDCNVIKYFSKKEYNGKIAATIVGAKNASPFFKNEKYFEFCTEAGVPLKTRCFRFNITENAALKPGTPLDAMHFKVGQFVDCTAKSVGYGFQGVIQRWNIGGGSHKGKLSHRRIGSIAGGFNKKVTKGRRLPGQMGGTFETTRGLKVLRINTRYNIIYVKGRIPGHVNQFVKIFDSTVYRYKPKTSEEAEKLIGPFPRYVPTDEKLPEEIFDKSVHQLNQPSIHLENENT